MKTETPLTTKLCNLPQSEFELDGELDALARKAGYSSGKAFANDCSMWNATLAEATEFLTSQPEA